MIDARGKGLDAAFLSALRMYNVSLRQVFCDVNCRHNVNATVDLDTLTVCVQLQRLLFERIKLHLTKEVTKTIKPSLFKVLLLQMILHHLTPSSILHVKRSTDSLPCNML